MITTLFFPPWRLDIPILDLQSAGLPAPSIIRMKLFTLDHRLIIRKLGVLHSQDQRSIEKSLKRLFHT